MFMSTIIFTNHEGLYDLCVEGFIYRLAISLRELAQPSRRFPYANVTAKP